MTRIFTLICAVLALCLAAPASADPALDSLARELSRVEGVRAVKLLQRSYAQYAQYGLWDEVGALFADDATFTFDGQVLEAQTATGPAAIADFLRVRYGGGGEGMSADGLSAMFIDNPVVNLSVDGASAKARWNIMIFHGHDGQARIEGGVFENDYAVDGGVWKISAAHYYPQYDGPYEVGWTNWGGGDLPIPPYHFDVDTSGIPIPPAEGTAPETDATLAELQARIDVLNEEDRIRNLQAIYGYYQDRKMWDDVVDLFAEDGVVEIGGLGVWQGKAGVRRWLETMGPAGLTHGQLNDRVQFDVIVTIAPGGNEAWARGIELGMLGEADQELGWWEVTTFLNRFVREDGVWKIRELRRFPQMKTDIFVGWGQSRIVDPVPTGEHAPDAPSSENIDIQVRENGEIWMDGRLVDMDAVRERMRAIYPEVRVFILAEPMPATNPERGGVYVYDVTGASDAPQRALAMPVFLEPHPVTGEPIWPECCAPQVAFEPLTGAIAPREPAPVDIAEAQRRLARSAAFDGADNVGAAYGYYVDDGLIAGWAGVLATNGFKQTPFVGWHIGRDRLIAARSTGAPPAETRPGISYHWLIQPALFISDDGRSVTGHVRLFQPRTGKEVGEAGAFFGANFWGGMYYNQYVLEDGIWRLWNLTLDEPFIVPVAWKDGVWARAKDPETPRENRPFTGAIPPDITLADIGERENHYWGGNSDVRQWPTILPMWFEFTNPVSGRVPELYQEDCVPCLVRPDLRLDRNGWQATPDAPEANRSP